MKVELLKRHSFRKLQLVGVLKFNLQIPAQISEICGLFEKSLSLAVKYTQSNLKMKITPILFSIISLFTLSCCNDPDAVEVSEGNFSFVPLKKWKFAFDQRDFEEDYRIYNATYEVKSEKMDTTVAIVSIYAQHLKDAGVECPSFERGELFPLQKAFQKKYGLKDHELCKVIDARKLVYCDSEAAVHFQFQNGDVWVQARLNRTNFDRPDLENFPELLDDFDTFIRSFEEI